jgi:ribosomal-protein-alanine N-acetyltransferase
MAQMVRTPTAWSCIRPRQSVNKGVRLVLPYLVERMTPADLEQVLEIERASFSRPWSVRVFVSELALPYACYLVARLASDRAVGQARARSHWPWWLAAKVSRPGPEQVALWQDRGPVVGYAGLQVILDEGHIMNLAVHPDYRGRGIAELLLLHQFAESLRRGALKLTLEVRPSNLPAQQLYLKYGFSEAGRRRRYYSDGEDAIIMWTDRIDTPESYARLNSLRERLMERLTVERAVYEKPLEETRDPDSGPGNLL